MMKRIIALILCIAMTVFTLSALAEQGGTPPQMPDGQMPSGDFAPSDGSQAGGFGPSDGSQDGGFAPSDGTQGGFPGGEMPQMPDGQMPSGDFGESSGFPAGGFSGGFPGGGEKVEGQLGSWSMGGTDAASLEGDDYGYDAALYVTADGVDEEKSATERLAEGAYDGTAADGIVIDDSETGHNGVLVVGTEYTISGAKIDLVTAADGTDTCDFSGKGAAIAVYGSDAKVTVEDSEVHTAGVAVTPLFADDGAVLTVKNSTMQSDGGTLYSGYLSTPTQNLMVAPPWILGIMGTSRCSNMMGNNTTMNVMDSVTSAGAWAVLSTDSGSNMALNVYNSSLTLNNADESKIPLQAEGGQISETLDNPYTENYGSGYGTFVIGSAVETFAGVEINAGTYAAIFNGGSASYGSLEAGKTYELKNAAGETTEVYEAQESKTSKIHSDTFGFMAMQNANVLNIGEGTSVESGYATFLVKTGYGGETLTATVDNAEITNGGVLIQVMDNDDATNGGMMSTTDPMNTNGGVQNFIPYHTEKEGFRTEAAGADSAKQAFTFTNGSYSGNIYNASGSDGLNGVALDVTFGAGAGYTGAIASTAAIHVTYEGSALIKENGGFAFDSAEEADVFADKYQNTYFTINEYWSIGQVANLVNSNGSNKINVTLADGAVWNVTATSLIDSLVIGDGCKVVVPEGVTLTVDGQAYTGCVLE